MDYICFISVINPTLIIFFYITELIRVVLNIPNKYWEKYKKNDNDVKQFITTNPYITKKILHYIPFIEPRQ